MKSTCLVGIVMLVILTSTGLTGAAIFYGTERFTGDIYAINTKMGTVERLVELALSAPYILVAGDSPNGNAFDADNNRFYFASFEDPGCPADISVSPSELYFVDLSNPTAIVWAGTLVGHASDAAFYGGQYWYIRHGTNDLAAVNVDSSGYVVGETELYDIWLTDPTTGEEYEPYLAFGDIEFDNEGLLYVTASTRNEVGGTRSVSGTFNIAAEQFTEIGENAYWVQIAFGEDGWLYGHATGTGDFYRVNTVSGAIMNTVVSGGPQLTDIASENCGVPKKPNKKK